MTEHDLADDRLPAIGHPSQEPERDEEPDFAEEHEDTAVDEDIVSGENEREEESPKGWAGMER
jgi:hypothetical protein